MLDGMTNIKASEVLKELKDYTEDLPHYSPDEVAEALEMANKALKKRWIPVSERLPEEDGEYYVTILNHLPNISNKTSVRILDFWVDGIDYHGATFHWGFYSGFSTSAIIAWMPLPEPYKAESEDAE